jgi:hypothetical protein
MTSSVRSQAIRGTAVVSPDGRYRYLLTRRVGPGRKTATFIMLNPSTADATVDDPTIRKCIGFSRRWRCGMLEVVNLFAFRATDPRHLKVATDPVGPANLYWILRTIAGAHGTVVCAWGVHGAHQDQDAEVLRWLRGRAIRLVALGLTRNGHPRHPLYAPYGSRLVNFRPINRFGIRGAIPDTVALDPSASRPALGIARLR